MSEVQADKKEIRGIIEQELLPYVYPVKVKHSLHIITKDTTDNRFMELAGTGKADYIVIGDKHLLELKSFHGIKILAPAEFFAFFKK